MFAVRIVAGGACARNLPLLNALGPLPASTTEE